MIYGLRCRRCNSDVLCLFDWRHPWSYKVVLSYLLKLWNSVKSFAFILIIIFVLLILSWIKRARKIAFARGEETTDYLRRRKPARTTGPACACKRECFDKVCERERQHILQTFNALADTNLQNVFLRGLIVGEEPQRLGPGGCQGVNKPGKEKKRSLVYRYCVQQSDFQRIQVCAFTPVIVSMLWKKLLRLALRV